MSVATNMEGNTICVLADSLSMPVKSFVPKYRAEFIEHVRLSAARSRISGPGGTLTAMGTLGPPCTPKNHSTAHATRSKCPS